MIKISVPTSDIDVNVHPNKTQIKFSKSDVIYSLLVGAIRSAIKKNNKSIQTEMNFSEEKPEVKQNNFFSREENQSFDLQNMLSSSTSIHGSNTHEMRTYEAPTLKENSTSFLIGHISPTVVLLHLENHFYVANLKQLMAQFLSSSFADFLLREESAGPLLISEPFRIPRGKIDNHLEDLKLLGLELDRLNPEVIALRTLPRFIPQALSRDITLCLIHYFEEPKTKSFNEQDFKQYVASNWEVNATFSENLLEKILGHSRDGLVQLSEQNLKVLFK